MTLVYIHTQTVVLGYAHTCTCMPTNILVLVIHYIAFTALIQLTLRRLMSYIYGAPILDVSRSHTTTQHSR